MKLKRLFIQISIVLMPFLSIFGQNVTLYHQFNGKYDFTFIGNTLNTIENNNIFGQPDPPCIINTSSSATLNLNPLDTIEKAYLYWAGSGNGDFEVSLNNQNIIAQRTFGPAFIFGLPYFSAFADITSLVQTTGNGLYTLSELDLTNVIIDYCDNRTNFGGWAILIVYKNLNLPLNQLNVYDGLQNVPYTLNITLNNLNVIDNVGAKIGFIAWEGDKNISVNETLRINGNIIGNPPLNPIDNAFNGTNSVTGESTLYNMDLDIYDIQNNIAIGDTSAQIQLTSNQDVVMINTIVTKLNSQLPDASIVLTNVLQTCNSRSLNIDYTINNTNCTSTLPAGTPIAIYANDIWVGQTQTTTNIPVDGSENGEITVSIPDTIPENFTLKIVVDDNGTGLGIVAELEENNNDSSISVLLWFSPKFNTLNPLFSCNEGLTKGTFNFYSYSDLVKVNSTDAVSFYSSLSDAENESNPIINTTNYTASTTPQTIFVRIENEHCFSITSFLLYTKNCPPTVYNYVSANDDGYNDTFFIKGLRDIFIHFELQIYNRWGKLIWQGNNTTPDWDGFAKEGLLLDDSSSPKGTYFYVLNLNDPDYPEPITGYLYYTK